MIVIRKIYLIYFTYRKQSSTFIKNCKKLQYQQSIQANHDTTFLLDWNDTAIQQLGSLSVRFSGVSSFHHPIQIENNSCSLNIEPRDFSNDLIYKYSNQDNICSTSWATSIMRIAEAAVNNTVKFSVDQLFYCIPLEYEKDSICDGIEPKLFVHYLQNIGLVQESDFIDCTSVNNAYR